MRLNLTDLAIQALKHPEKGQTRHFDTQLRGFGVVVGTKTKTFIVVTGKERKLTVLGRYPEMSLKEARQEAKKLQTVKHSSLAPKTFLEAKSAFLERAKSRVKLDTYKQYVYHLDKCSFAKDIKDVTKRDILNALKVFEGKPTSQNLMLSTLRNFFNWCVAEELIDHYPLTRVASPNKLKSRERVLTDDELVKIWNACPDHTYGKIIKLLILTGQRRQEIADLVVNDDKILIIPDTKNGTTQRLPITPLVRQYLPTPSFTFNNWQKRKIMLDKASGVTGWRVHDLRRTCATNMVRLGVSSDVVEAVLNHKQTGVKAIYQRWHYLPQIEEALLTIEAHILKITRPGHQPGPCAHGSSMESCHANLEQEGPQGQDHHLDTAHHAAGEGRTVSETRPVDSKPGGVGGE